MLKLAWLLNSVKIKFMTIIKKYHLEYNRTTYAIRINNKDYILSTPVAAYLIGYHSLKTWPNSKSIKNGIQETIFR